jgi:hypothetical protein
VTSWSTVSFSRRSHVSTSSASSSAARFETKPPQNAAQNQELGHDLARREAEGLPLASVLAGLRGKALPR